MWFFHIATFFADGKGWFEQFDLRTTTALSAGRVFSFWCSCHFCLEFVVDRLILTCLSSGINLGEVLKNFFGFSWIVPQKFYGNFFGDNKGFSRPEVF